MSIIEPTLYRIHFKMTLIMLCITYSITTELTLYSIFLNATVSHLRTLLLQLVSWHSGEHTPLLLSQSAPRPFWACVPEQAYHSYWVCTLKNILYSYWACCLEHYATKIGFAFWSLPPVIIWIPCQSTCTTTPNHMFLSSYDRTTE